MHIRNSMQTRTTTKPEGTAEVQLKKDGQSKKRQHTNVTAKQRASKQHKQIHHQKKPPKTTHTTPTETRLAPTNQQDKETPQDEEKGDNNTGHLHNGSMIVTNKTKAMWRQCLHDVTTINIPHVNTIRPMKTRNAFVTKAIVLVAYLIVHAAENEPMPKISGKFKISPLRHNTNDIEQEIANSGIDYTDAKLRWNGYTSAAIHVGACLSIGSWLANQLAKARNHGTWRIVGNEVHGSTKGLYEPYRDLLRRIGIDVPMKTTSI